MRVLGLLSRKGGAGKTTLALHLAVLAQASGRRTLLVDVDPQRSAAGWWRAREADTPQLVETEPDKLRELLQTAREDGVDTAVIDTRASAEADAAHVAALCDMLLVPARPAILDMRAILGTRDVIKGAARRSMIVLNACPPARGAGEAT
jgi:chromosome partitioning protein